MKKGMKILPSMFACIMLLSVIGGTLYASRSNTAFSEAFRYVLGLQLVYGLPLHLLSMLIFHMMASPAARMHGGGLWMHLVSFAYGGAWGIVLSIGLGFQPSGRQIAGSILTFGFAGWVYGILYRYWINPAARA